jgi:hypothetical protein
VLQRNFSASIEGILHCHGISGTSLYAHAVHLSFSAGIHKSSWRWGGFCAPKSHPCSSAPQLHRIEHAHGSNLSRWCPAGQVSTALGNAGWHKPMRAGEGRVPLPAVEKILGLGQVLHKSGGVATAVEKVAAALCTTPPMLSPTLQKAAIGFLHVFMPLLYKLLLHTAIDTFLAVVLCILCSQQGHESRQKTLSACTCLTGLN